jgi:hypothetical protein
VIRPKQRLITALAMPKQATRGRKAAVRPVFALAAHGSARRPDSQTLPERHACATQLQTTADQDAGGNNARTLGELGDQARLADPCLTTEEDRRSLACGDTPEQLLQLRDLCCAADEDWAHELRGHLLIVSVRGSPQVGRRRF